MNMPWFKFYPRDWIADTELRSCSFAARGLWMDLLTLMSMNERRRGYLEQNGQAITDPGKIARLTGGESADVAALLKELEDNGVLSREDGVICSRRMVRDESVSETKRRAGLKGGNPVLKQVNKPVLKQVDNGVLKPRIQTPEPDIRSNPIQSVGTDSESVFGVGGIVDGLVKKTTCHQFQKPTLQEVQAYMATLFHGGDKYAEPFFTAKDQSGWRDKSGKMVSDWKAMAKAYANTCETNKRVGRAPDRNYGQIKPTQNLAIVARAKGNIR